MQLDPLALTLTSSIVGVVMMGMLAFAPDGEGDSPVPRRWWLAGNGLFVAQHLLLLLPAEAYRRVGLLAPPTASVLPLYGALLAASIACECLSLAALFWRRWRWRHQAAAVAAAAFGSFALLTALGATRWQHVALVATASLGEFVKCRLIAPQWRRYQGARVLVGLTLLIAASGLVIVSSGQVFREHWSLSPQGQLLPPLFGLILQLFVSTLNTLAFMQLMQERLLERIRRLGTTDVLTGLLNRRGIESALTRELAAALRERRPLALALIDLDHFKRINDEFGHDVGDRVLAGFGQRLLHGVRSGDSAGRWGGEEFLVVMPGSTLADAVQAIERVRDATRAEPLAEQAPRVTLSAGVCALPGDGQSIEWLVQRADRALYRAKVRRDQVCAEPSSPADHAETAGASGPGSLASTAGTETAPAR